MFTAFFITLPSGWKPQKRLKMTFHAAVKPILWSKNIVPQTAQPCFRPQNALAQAVQPCFRPQNALAQAVQPCFQPRKALARDAGDGDFGGQGGGLVGSRFNLITINTL
jgi:hypothetical protein